MSSMSLIPKDPEKPKEQEFLGDYSPAPPEMLAELEKQLEEERVLNWAKAKKTFDTMDFYDFLIYWYELEIKTAWCWYHWYNEQARARMEKRCRYYVKGTDAMPAATKIKLRMLALNDAPDVGQKEFLKEMCRLRGHAYAWGVKLAIKIGELPFNTFEMRILHDVRKEVLRRFIENRTIAAEEAKK